MHWKYEIRNMDYMRNEKWGENEQNQHQFITHQLCIYAPNKSNKFQYCMYVYYIYKMNAMKEQNRYTVNCWYYKNGFNANDSKSTMLLTNIWWNMVLFYTILHGWQDQNLMYLLYISFGADFTFCNNNNNNNKGKKTFP